MQYRKMLYKAEPNIQEPAYSHDGDAGLDLRIKEPVTLAPGETKLTGTGLCFEIPTGCVGLLFPRSGLATKKGVNLANCVGVIDSGYRGEVGIPLYNISAQAVELEAGERVAQLVVMPFVPCSLERVEHLTASERGVNGFGSTGTK